MPEVPRDRLLGTTMSQYTERVQTASTAQQPTGMEFPTESYLDQDVRRSINGRLNRALADATVLTTHAKFAHWNVKGRSFYSLHRLFDEVAEAVEDHVDLIAERITALGGQALGTAGMAVSGCRLPPMPADLVTGEQYVHALVDGLATFDANLAEDIHAATELGDLDTADLLNEVSREVSKYRWFLEAHVQTQPIGTAGGAQHAGPAQSGGQFQGGEAEMGRPRQDPSQPGRQGQPPQPGQYQQGSPGPTGLGQEPPRSQRGQQARPAETGAAAGSMDLAGPGATAPGGEPDPTRLQTVPAGGSPANNQ